MTRCARASERAFIGGPCSERLTGCPAKKVHRIGAKLSDDAIAAGRRFTEFRSREFKNLARVSGPDVHLNRQGRELLLPLCIVLLHRVGSHQEQVEVAVGSGFSSCDRPEQPCCHRLDRPRRKLATDPVPQGMAQVRQLQQGAACEMVSVERIEVGSASSFAENQSLKDQVIKGILSRTQTDSRQDQAGHVRPVKGFSVPARTARTPPRAPGSNVDSG